MLQRAGGIVARQKSCDQTRIAVMRYRVMVKKFNAYQAWTVRGTYGSESAALSMAEKLARDYAFVRVVDEDGRVVWSA